MRTNLLHCLPWIVTLILAGCGSDRHVESRATIAPAADPPAAYANVRGGSYRLPDQRQCKAVALLFVGVECPVSNTYAPEIIRLCREYAPKGISFCIVYPDPDLSLPDARKHANDFGFPCQAVLDTDLRLTRKVGATITPEAAVLSPGGELLYLGRIDDRYFALGQQRAKPAHRDLREALDAVLSGRPAPVSRTRAIGCSISFPAGGVHQ